MAVGSFTTDNIDFNEVLNRYELPKREAWNLNALMDYRRMFCQDYDEGYWEFPVERLKAQELGPHGKPDPQQQVYIKKSRDVRKFGMGWSYTWEYLARRTTERIAQTVDALLNVDEDMVNALILSTLFDASTHFGLINTVYAGGMTAPPSYGQNTFTSAHTHYITSGTASLSTLSPISAAKQHMAEHGDSGPYFALINSENVEDIENMARWDTAGANITNPITDRVAINGYKGRMLGVDWIETEWVPADYIIFVSQRRSKELVAFVEMTAGKGLMLFNDQGPITRESLSNTPVGSYPIVNSYYLRWFNTYVLRRSAAVVLQITTGSYSAPNVTQNILMAATSLG